MAVHTHHSHTQTGQHDSKFGMTREELLEEASLTQPGQPKFDVNTFDGEMVSKDVAIKAQLTSPEGQKSEKDLVITMSKVGGTQGGTPREGKWIITKIAGL